MLSVGEPAEVSDRDVAWFNGEGCALISAVYLTACLFAQLKRVREDIPYLRLSGADDTRLAALLLSVQRGYLADLGVYYVTQPSIGESMWKQGGAGLLTYREFCEKLQKPQWRIWLDRLIQFQLDTAQGHASLRTRRLLDAINELSEFLDGCVGGGNSIGSRQTAEES